MSEREDPSGGPPWEPPERRRNVLPWVLLLFVPLLIWLLDPFGPGDEDAPEIPYSAFRDQVEAGNVERVLVRGSRITGRLRTPVPLSGDEDPAEAREFATHVPAFGDEALLAELRARGVEIEARPEADGEAWITLLVTLLPLLLLVGLVLLLVRGAGARQGELFSFGQSRARIYRRTDEATTFDDVAGAESAKEELREVIDFLRDPGRFHALGAKVPRGVLLVGPPGTGKTLIARAVAGEAGVPFFSITGSDFMEMLVGVGASRVRDLFRRAKEAAPSIIFIDELDSIGRTRGAGIGGGHDEREQTLNQLLSELDGFEPTMNVIVMAATNRPDILDPALTRAGRFDRHVLIDLPTAADRELILRVHARRKPLARDVDLERLAKSTPGLSGAELENILNEAALTAARKRRRAIHADDVDEARDRVLLGLERRGLALSEEERELIAYHEAGHAVVAAALPTTDPVHKLSIVPRGRAMGATQQLQERERYVYTRQELLERIAVLLGGRAAERLVFDTAATGAEDDLGRATSLARKMVLAWGMSEGLGPMATGREEAVFLGEELARRREFSEDTAREVDREVRRLLDEAAGLARDTLSEHRDELDVVAAWLLDREQIAGEEVEELVERARSRGRDTVSRGGEPGTGRDAARGGLVGATGRPAERREAPPRAAWPDTRAGGTKDATGRGRKGPLPFGGERPA